MMYVYIEHLGEVRSGVIYVLYIFFFGDGPKGNNTYMRGIRYCLDVHVCVISVGETKFYGRVDEYIEVDGD